jgi:peptidoglycan/LPS O-acetylase OafA/YrhL
MSKKVVAIQYLRALSVLAVLLYHVGFNVPNGYLGVDVFFVISGFVITQSLMRMKTSSTLDSIIYFFKKRIARLFPAFLLVFFFTILAVLAVYSPNMGVQQSAIRTGAGALFAVSNFILIHGSGDYFGATNQSNPFLHTWSLAVEEQFYLFFPLLYFFILKKFNKQNIIFGILATIGIFSLALSYLNPIPELDLYLNYFSPFTRVWEFTLGIIAAYAKSKQSDSSSSWHRALQFILFSIISLMLLMPSKLDLNHNTFLIALLIQVALFLFISNQSACKLQHSNKLITHLGNLFSFFGDISYSLYLWHWPLIVTYKQLVPVPTILERVLLVICSIFLASLTYSKIETRFIQKNALSNSYWFKFLGSGVGAGVISIILMYLGVANGWNTNWALGSHKVISRGCDSGTLSFENCWWLKSESKDSILLVGDSMAWSIGNSIIEAAHRLNLNAQVLAKNGCSASSTPSESDLNCSFWRKKIFRHIVETKPKVVVLANTKGNSKQDLEGIGQLASNILKSDIPVIMVLSLYGGDEFSARRALFFRPGPRDRNFRQVVEDIDPYQIAEVIEDRNFRLLSIGDFLCKNNICPNAIQGNDVFTYGGHLSSFGNSLILNSLTFELGKFLNYQISSKTKRASR